jgi:hypothetical protein
MSSELLSENWEESVYSQMEDGGIKVLQCKSITMLDQQPPSVFMTKTAWTNVEAFGRAWHNSIRKVIWA